MKWLRDYKLFKEARQEKVSYKNLVSEICTAMVLLNNEFLDNILDRGLKARYSENSEIFITDLKNLLLAKNRLNLGRFEGDTCVADGEISKANSVFETIEFDIEKDMLNFVLDFAKKVDIELEIEPGKNYSNTSWHIDSMEVSNLFSYGADPVKFDFNNLKGLTGIFGPNYSGKTFIVGGDEIGFVISGMGKIRFARVDINNFGATGRVHGNEFADTIKTKILDKEDLIQFKTDKIK